PDRSLCRYTETSLGDYDLPLMIQGMGSCAQFCSADYWVTNTDSGAELLRFGHGGAMGPPLLAIGPFGPSLSGPLATAFRLHRVQWVPAANPQAIDDGWYEDTTYTWDAAGGVLVEGPTQRVGSD